MDLETFANLLFDKEMAERFIKECRAMEEDTCKAK